MRVLIVGDEAGIHDFDRARALEATYCGHGEEAVAAVDRARVDGTPFAAAFVDIRVSAGLDGTQTIRRIRAADPDINLVVVTGLTDCHPLDIGRVAGPADKIFYIARPFEPEEIFRMAIALGRRWQAEHDAAGAHDALTRKVAELEERQLELAANENRAIHIAYHDSLTDAPNRLSFQRALSKRAGAGGCFATAMIDLDRFKLVNDTLGHLAGDELIRFVCGILQHAVPSGGLVARLGGDEFGLLFDTPGENAALMDCERIVGACSVTTKVFGNSVQGSASIGLVVSSGEGAVDPVDLMRRADLALNDAKRAGRGVVRLFDESMDESIRFRRRIEGGLGVALAQDELSLAYQPIVARQGLEVVGFEVLLRWNTPEYGPISPSIFIPIAEESNLIHELEDWVLARALEVVKQWPGQYISINFSPRQFRRHNFVGHIMESVQHAGVEPSRVQIEITETAIFDDAERAADTLYKLRQMGFRIALDDFGTGYSSLDNIRKFALDSLKIDRSFIDGMGRERESAAIVHSIIHLGRALGLGIIAEGVETDAQVQALRLAGASHLQGYYFSRPVTADVARDLAEMRFLEDAGAAEPADVPVTPVPQPAQHG